MDKQTQIDAAFREICMLRVSRAPMTRSLTHIIYNSVQAGYYSLIPSLWGNNIGYLIWAQVSEESIRFLHLTGHLPSFQYEWNEGAINLILDVFYWNSGHRLPSETILNILPTDVDQIAYFRRGRVKLLRRIRGRLSFVALNNFLVESWL